MGLDRVAIELFGGVDQLFEIEDITSLDDVFCVDTGDLSQASGPCASYPDGQPFGLVL